MSAANDTLLTDIMLGFFDGMGVQFLRELVIVLYVVPGANDTLLTDILIGVFG